MCEMQMADLSEIAHQHCQDKVYRRNARVLYCGDYFDDGGPFQMEQGLGPALDRSPVADTCFWVGKIVGKVDSAGKIKVSIDIV